MPVVKLMPLIACSPSGCDDQAILNAIYYAVDNGARIINLSISSGLITGYSSVYDEAIKYAYSNNVVIVVAAGNGDIDGGVGIDLSEVPESPVCNDVGENMILGSIFLIFITRQNTIQRLWILRLIINVT